jgi:hypothetical protein
MPDPYERHARPGKHAFYGEPPKGSRGQLRDAAAQEQLVPEILKEGKRPPGKKDPDLCKARHWKGPHTPELRVRAPWSRRRADRVSCYWGLPYWSDIGQQPLWYCSHEEHCSGCGKILRTRISDVECPLYHEIIKAEREAIETEAGKIRDQRAKWRYRKRPLITGPQGYRKKRDG